MKKVKLILAALFSLLSLTSTAQEINYLQDDFSNFLGRWIAQDKDLSYEIDFSRNLVSMGEERLQEMVLGKLIYKKGDIILRETEVNGFASILYSRTIYSVITSPYNMSFIFRDELRSVRAYIEFSINESDPLKAVFKLIKYEGTGWNTENKIDIPDGITFYEVME